MSVPRHEYGKSGVRLVKLTGEGNHREILQLDVSVLLSGDFESAHSQGDNTKVIPTDTVKNTIYALAHGNEIESPEQYAILLGDHFSEFDQVDEVKVKLATHKWLRLHDESGEHPNAFRKGSGEQRTCRLHRRGKETDIFGGIEGLHILKATESGFSGFPRVEYTSLKETDNRIMATVMKAEWKWNRKTDYNSEFAAIRYALLETFGDHYSKSLQDTLYRMGNAALQASPALDCIDLEMPNKHNLLVDLSAFNIENKNVVFVATDEPFGLISASVDRS